MTEVSPFLRVILGHYRNEEEETHNLFSNMFLSFVYLIISLTFAEVGLLNILNLAKALIARFTEDFEAMPAHLRLPDRHRKSVRITT